MGRIYLDHNATTPIRPQVQEMMVASFGYALNASSLHASGREASKRIELARRQLLESIGACGARIIFTSSGTEANNLALYGLNRIDEVLVSAVEHSSVINTRKEKIIIPVDTNGVVDVGAFEKLLKQSGSKSLVSIMLANNETGVIQPIDKIVDISHQYGALVHTDAVQAFAKIDIDFNALGVDMMTVSAHKIGGPQGAAALICKKPLHFNCQQQGGGQEFGYRAGTENVAAIIGFGVAASLAKDYCQKIQHLVGLRDYLEKTLKEYVPDVVVFGQDSHRLPNTSYISMPGVSMQTQLIHFDLLGVDVSTGAACSSGKVDTSHVLRSMGVDSELSSSAIRVSLGINTTKEEIDVFIDGWKQLFDRTNNVNMKIKVA